MSEINSNRDTRYIVNIEKVKDTYIMGLDIFYRYFQLNCIASIKPLYTILSIHINTYKVITHKY